MENVVADHLSRLTIAQNTHNPPINDEIPEESLLLVENTLWYADIANYWATGELPTDWKAQDKKFFFTKIHSYYWEEPFLYKYCADQIIRRCVPEAEQQGILSHCHENACGGHFASLFKDAHTMCRECDKCQRLGNISRHHMMPLNPILVFDIFDVWDHSLPSLDTSTFWWELTMCKNGLKQCLAEQQTTGWC